ncbi:hypothetical protein XaC1_71 [Xanthomonas phage XaC1]|nr:hypothetical protein XaC1_71 [Xanthomonas phage XaC1]
MNKIKKVPVLSTSPKGNYTMRDIKELQAKAQSFNKVLKYLLDDMSYKARYYKTKFGHVVTLTKRVSLSSVRCRHGTLFCIDHSENNSRIKTSDIDGSYQERLADTRALRINNNIYVQDIKTKITIQVLADEVQNDSFALSTVLSNEAYELVLLISMVDITSVQDEGLYMFSLCTRYIDELLIGIENEELY